MRRVSLQLCMPIGELRTHFWHWKLWFLIDGTILFNCFLLDITQDAKNEKLLGAGNKNCTDWKLGLDLI